MINNNTATLLRRWADMHEMCVGSSIKPYECVKCEGGLKDGFKELYEDSIAIKDFASCYGWTYQFALCILENRPVFAGDVLYVNAFQNLTVTVKDICTNRDFLSVSDYGYDVLISHLSWEKPKKQPISIVEGKDVYVDDVLYCRDFRFSVKELRNGKLYGVDYDNYAIAEISPKNCSWDKPKQPIANIEGKDVFVGDTAYLKHSGESVTVLSANLDNSINIRTLTGAMGNASVSNLSLSKPQNKTITINGKEFVAPNDRRNYVLGRAFGSKLFNLGWDTARERDEVENEIIALLQPKKDRKLTGYASFDNPGTPPNTDPYAKLKQAQLDGKVIKFTDKRGIPFYYSSGLKFTSPVEHYEILE